MKGPFRNWLCSRPDGYIAPEAPPPPESPSHPLCTKCGKPVVPIYGDSGGFPPPTLHAHCPPATDEELPPSAASVEIEGVRDPDVSKFLASLTELENKPVRRRHKKASATDKGRVMEIIKELQDHGKANNYQVWEVPARHAAVYIAELERSLDDMEARWAMRHTEEANRADKAEARVRELEANLKHLANEAEKRKPNI